MGDRFVKLSHLVEDGQQIIFRVNEEGEICQFLEFWDGQWHGVAGICSGIPFRGDIVKFVGQMKYGHEYTKTIKHFHSGPDGKFSHTTEETLPFSPEEQEQYAASLTIVVNSSHGPQQLKYERVEPPDCDDIKLFGHSTLAKGYYIVEDNGELNTTPAKDEPLPQ